MQRQPALRRSVHAPTVVAAGTAPVFTRCTLANTATSCAVLDGTPPCALSPAKATRTTWAPLPERAAREYIYLFIYLFLYLYRNGVSVYIAITNAKHRASKSRCEVRVTYRCTPRPSAAPHAVTSPPPWRAPPRVWWIWFPPLVTGRAWRPCCRAV